MQLTVYTAQKLKFSIKGFFSKFEQIPSFLRICSHLPKNYLMKNFLFCAGIHEKIIWTSGSSKFFSSAVFSFQNEAVLIT